VIIWKIPLEFQDSISGPGMRLPRASISEVSARFFVGGWPSEKDWDKLTKGRISAARRVGAFGLRRGNAQAQVLSVWVDLGAWRGTG
jgi:hypothetical protein